MRLHCFQFMVSDCNGDLNTKYNDISNYNFISDSLVTTTASQPGAKVLLSDFILS